MNITLHFNAVPFQKSLLHWYQSNNIGHPWRLDWQRWQNPYHVLVSEIMLQQTVIKAVLPAYQRFVAALPDIASLGLASEGEVRQLVRGLGYYSRFRRLHLLAQSMLAEMNDQEHTEKSSSMPWPRDYEGWLALPGIGPYTAAAISSIALNLPHAVVDGNVERVLCRLFDIRQPVNAPALKPTYRSLAQQLLAINAPGDFNQAMMELGQLVCRKASPDCDQCPVSSHCLAHQRQSQHLAPQDKIKKSFKQMSLLVTIAAYRGKVGILRDRRQYRFLKNMPGFAMQEISKLPKDLKSFRHTITNHKLTVYVEQKQLTAADYSNVKEVYDWFKPEQVSVQLGAKFDAKAWQLVDQRR